MMAGENENHSRCLVCGGRLAQGMATIPFMFPNMVVLVKEVPAEICNSCHEPYMAGKVTDKLTSLLEQLHDFHAEVLIISYADMQPLSTAPPV